MTYSRINFIIDKLRQIGIEPEIPGVSEFYDEPKFCNYTARLKLDWRHFSDYKAKNYPDGFGVSFVSNEIALFKALCEAMERFCLAFYRKKDLRHEAYSSDPATFINLSDFSSKPDIENQKLDWIEGINLVTGKKCFIPAQLVFLNKLAKHEHLFDFPRNSTGAAIGSSHEQALLNGIYEVIERDSFMTVYLNTISPPIVDLEKLNNKAINYILDKFLRYKLELYVLEVTNDLGIPSFLSVIIDRTGLGPAVALGAKSGLRSREAIIGAICESWMCRIYEKLMLKDGSISQDLKKGTTVFADRAKDWILPEAIRNIEFLISGPVLKRKIKSFTVSMEEELVQVLDRLKGLNLNIYYSDIALKEFKSLNFFVYKTIIPGLHPLYLYEGEKERAININRLKQVAMFFKKRYQGLNPTPHPFL